VFPLPGPIVAQIVANPAQKCAPLVAHHVPADMPRTAGIALAEALRKAPIALPQAPRETHHVPTQAPRETHLVPPEDSRAVHHGPYTAWLVARTVAQKSARSSPRSCASHRAVAAARYGALGRPRQGCGVRKGASVSTMRWASGVSTAAARTSLALRNVAVPARER